SPAITNGSEPLFVGDSRRRRTAPQDATMEDFVRFWSPILLAASVAAPVWAEPPPVRITFDGSFKQHLHWSPDGKKFLFTRIHQGKMALWTVNTDGTDLKRLLPNLDTPHFDGHWSPDGKTILYVHDILQGTDGKLHIYRVNADGSESKVVIPNKA